MSSGFDLQLFLIFPKDYFTYAKVFALIIIVGTGFYNLFNGQTQHFTWDNTETDISVIGRGSRSTSGVALIWLNSLAA